MGDLLHSRVELQERRAPHLDQLEWTRRAAREVVAELGYRTPPVHLGMLVSLLGIDGVVEDPDLAEAGCLICDCCGRFEIRVRGGDSPRRRRFTICHECSHTFFPGYATEVQFRCTPQQYRRQKLDLEMLCDVAASELLLPHVSFLPDALESSFGFDGLGELSDRYNASLEATGHRLVSVWNEPAAFLVLSERQSPRQVGSSAPPKLRLDYAHPEGPWPYFLKHKSTDPNDSFSRALQGEIESETTTITGITASPIVAEVQAMLAPITTSNGTVMRVVALARQVGRQS